MKSTKHPLSLSHSTPSTIAVSPAQLEPDGLDPARLSLPVNNDCGPESAALASQSSARHQAQRDKRDQYFLRGPIPFAWIRQNIPDAASRVVLVAQAFMDMDRSTECILSPKVWDCAGVEDRYTRRRILGRLRKQGGDFTIGDRKGKSSVLRKRE